MFNEALLYENFLAVARGRRMMTGTKIFQTPSKPKLPYDAEVEYLESTGTQWIDTLFKPTSQTRVVVDTAFTSRSVFGVVSSSNYASWFCFTTGTATTVRYYYGSRTNYDYTIDKKARRVYDVSKDFMIDGETVYTSSNTLAAASLNMYIFGRNNNGSPNDLLVGKIFSCQVYDGQILVRDFIPVRFTNELNETEGAMYDKVSGQLFRNQGSEAFLFGRDISPVSARSYIQDGLIAMWDGIENAGWEVHDAITGTVVNLLDQSMSTAFIVNGNSFVLDKTGKTLLTGGLPEVFTIEYVFTDIGLVDINTFMLASQQSVLSRGLWLMPTYFYMRSYNVSAGRANYNGRSYGTLSSIIKRTVEGQPTFVYAYGEQVTTDWKTSSTTYVLDRIAASSTTTNRNVNFYSIRLYSRELTAEEITANYAIDKERFKLL